MISMLFLDLGKIHQVSVYVVFRGTSAQELEFCIEDSSNWTKYLCCCLQITRREAEALVQEWVNLGLWDDLHEVLWEEVHEMFKEHQFPGILAGVFFLRQAVNLNKKISKEEVQDLVVRAISWLKGDIVSVPEDSASKLTAGLRRALFLYGGDPQHLAKIMPQKV